jgi:SAM-dependent methyltransferase
MNTTLLRRLTRHLRSGVKANVGLSGQAAADSEPPRLRRLVAEPWYVDRIDVCGQRLSAAGWSLPGDLRAPPSEGWFTVNGRAFDELRYPLPRPDVGAVFWMREGAGSCGFEGSIEHLPEAYPGGVLEIRRVDPDTTAIERGRDSWFIPDPALHADLPGEDRRVRVIGDPDAAGFLISGATDYHRIDRALVAISGRHLHEFRRVLDWGVGCGRIARHFPSEGPGALTGCDIDQDNVDWCGAHLPGTFVSCSMTPPLPFGAASFDLVYGISVFTHLREAMQLKWLDELYRVMAAGALLLTTIHGRTALDFSRLAPAEHRRLCEEVEARGIVVRGEGSQLDGHVDHGGEYVADVAHSLEYVHRVWGRFFEVVQILRGYILFQDLVVLRRR